MSDLRISEVHNTSKNLLRQPVLVRLRALTGFVILDDSAAALFVLTSDAAMLPLASS